MRSEQLSERVDLRSYSLRLKKGIRLPLLATAVGAVLGLLLYFLATTVFGPGRLYRAESRLYINFSPAMAQSAYPYYNDYTWRDLVVTDEILDATLEYLRTQGFTIAEESDPDDMGVRTLSAAEVRETTYVTLPSDIRLMIAQFTNHDPVIANAVMTATDAALVAFGEAHEEFDSIEIRAEDVAEIVTYTDRTPIALVTGAGIGLLFGIFLLLVKELFDETVYTPAELAQRFKLPVLGVLLKSSGKAEAVRAMTENDLSDALRSLAAKGMQTLCLIAADTTQADAAASDARALSDLCSGEGMPAITSAPTPGSEAGALFNQEGADAVILSVRAGVDRATMTRRCINALTNADIQIAGLLLTEADASFLSAYYRMR